MLKEWFVGADAVETGVGRIQKFGGTGWSISYWKCVGGCE